MGRGNGMDILRASRMIRAGGAEAELDLFRFD
jgi:hypothetical protein